MKKYVINFLKKVVARYDVENKNKELITDNQKISNFVENINDKRLKSLEDKLDKILLILCHASADHKDTKEYIVNVSTQLEELLFSFEQSAKQEEDFFYESAKSFVDKKDLN